MTQNKVDQGIKIAIGVLLLGLAWVIVGSMHERIVDVGDSAPKFTVKTESGAKVSATDFGGKLLLLNFWASWCPPCVEEAPSLNQLQKTLAPSGLVVLGVSIDQKDGPYKDFLKRFNIAFPTSRDPEQDISYAYGTYKVPESYLIDRSGKVLQKYIGGENWIDPQIVNEIKSHL